MSWDTILVGSGADILGNIVAIRPSLFSDVWESGLVKNILFYSVSIIPDVVVTFWTFLPVVIKFTLYFAFLYIVFIRPFRKMARL